MRIGFFGTPSLSAGVLQDLLDASGIEVVFAVTNPDKPIGRSGELQPTPVKSLATLHGIPVFTPTKIRDNEEFLEAIALYNCDYFVVVAYGRILPNSILEMPQKICINVHGSILPAYRGASPIQAALLHGEKETGVTIMKMSEGMDEGDILKIQRIPIDTNETSETLFEKFADISGSVLIEALQGIEAGQILPIPQDHTRATYCKKIEKEDGMIDWNQSAISIYHKWQAYTPWPGIFTIYDGKRLLLEKVALFPSSGGTKDPGLETINAGFFVNSEGRNVGGVIKMETGEIGIVCGEGILTLDQVKLEGKKSQSIRDFINGNQKFISSKL